MMNIVPFVIFRHREPQRSTEGHRELTISEEYQFDIQDLCDPLCSSVALCVIIAST
jgi:hypothetical protein